MELFQKGLTISGWGYCPLLTSGTTERWVGELLCILMFELDSHTLYFSYLSQRFEMSNSW